MKQKQAHKVAYHDGFGPFALPLVAAERFCELAGIKADLYERSKVSDVYFIEDDVPRHDENLIRAIEEFPRECAKAQIFLHPVKGDKYFITVYDGLEEVKEPEDFDWVYLQTKGANQMSTKTTKKLKDEETTIILELTPREAAAIHSLVWCANWSKGDYGKECRDIANTLVDVANPFDHHVPYVADKNGIAIGGSFWLVDEENNDENLHSYSGA